MPQMVASTTDRTGRTNCKYQQLVGSGCSTQGWDLGRATRLEYCRSFLDSCADAGRSSATSHNLGCVHSIATADWGLGIAGSGHCNSAVAAKTLKSHCRQLSATLPET